MHQNHYISELLFLPHATPMNKLTIVYLAYFVLAGSMGWCVLHFKRLLPEFRVLALYVFLSAGVQAGAWLLASRGINNLALSHIYAVLGFMVLANFYRLLVRPFIRGRLFVFIAVGYLLLAVMNVILWEPLHTFNSIPLTAEAVVFIILSLSTFVLTLTEDLNQHLRPMLRSLNWINSGILLYFAGSLLLFYHGETIIHVIIGRWGVYTWTVHAVLSIILHTCLLIGLWMSPKA
jgi:hypothetical protein